MDSIIITPNGSKYQLGKYNNRIYIIKLSNDEPLSTIDFLIGLIKNNMYRKIIIRSDNYRLSLFLYYGFSIEAVIPGYFNQDRDLFFISLFSQSNINTQKCKDKLRELFLSSQKKVSQEDEPTQSQNIRPLQINDCDALANLYANVFESYPFPIFDSTYLKETMEKQSIHYFGIWENNKLLAASSLEIDSEASSAEVTDFAVRKEYRGKHFSSHLLHVMEIWLRENGIITAYTIARLQSKAINMTFLNNGYKYSGTLFANTQISGAIESMNIYYKLLLNHD